MRTTFDDIPGAVTLATAEPVVAPSNVFTSNDGAFAIVNSAFRQPLLDGREPHAVFLTLEEGMDPDAVLPDGADVVRSASDDDDCTLLARGLGYSILISTAGPVAIVSAGTREQAQALAEGLRERAREANTAHQQRTPGQYL